MLAVPGIAGIPQTRAGGVQARRPNRLSRSLLTDADLSKAVAAAAHTVVYGYFRAGLDIIIAGIKASGAQS